MLAATCCVVLTVGYTTMNAVPSYTVHSEVIVHNGSLSDIMSYGPAETNISLIDTCLEIFNSQSAFVHMKEVFLTDQNYTVEQLDEMIEVTSKAKDSLVLYVTVTCDNPDDALYLSEMFLATMPDYAQNISGSLAVNQLMLGSEAKRDRPDVFSIVLLSTLTGAVVSSLLVILFGAVNRKINGADDYKSHYSAPLLGVVPDFGKNNKGGK